MKTKGWGSHSRKEEEKEEKEGKEEEEIRTSKADEGDEHQQVAVRVKDGVEILLGVRVTAVMEQVLNEEPVHDHERGD